MSALTYSAAEAARALGVSEATVRRLARRDQIPHMRLGTRLVFPKAALDSWISRETRTA